MNLNKLKPILKYWWPVILVILCSFFFYSSRFYPRFNSDDALAVLMTHDFKLPEALYCWMQNRGGSLIPLLAQIPHKILGLSAVWSESLIHYLVLILGYFGMSSTLSTRKSKLLLSVIWFLPVVSFIGFTRHSWGILYSLFGILIWLWPKLKSSREKSRKTLYSLAIFIISACSIWVMDQAAILLGTIIVFKLIKELKDAKYRLRAVFSIENITIFSGYLVAISINIYLKSIAIIHQYDSYSKQYLNSGSEVIESAGLMIQTIKDLLCFQTLNPALSVYTFIIISLIGTAVAVLRNLPKSTLETKSLILIACIVLINLTTHWTLKNQIPSRYFSGAHLLFWIYFLARFEAFEYNSIKTKTISVLVSLALLMGPLSALYKWNCLDPKTLESKYSRVTELDQLGEIGIIANYWNAYSLSFKNPDNVVATAHDKSSVRNRNYINQVFEQPQIFIVKDMWLEEFPDKLTQFNRELIKKGKPFQMAEATMCEYQLSSVE